MAKRILRKEQLLAEIEDILKTMPPRSTIRHHTEENVNWFGRVSAAIEKWTPSKRALVKEYLDLFFSNGHARETAHGLTKLLTLLNQAQSELRLELAGAHESERAQEDGFQEQLPPKNVSKIIFIGHGRSLACLAPA